jgi:hypothetical protein
MPALAQSLSGGREHQQAIPVVVEVAECDEAFVAAAIVPREGQPRDLRTDAVVENALEILDDVFIDRLVIIVGAPTVAMNARDDRPLRPCRRAGARPLQEAKADPGGVAAGDGVQIRAFFEASRLASSFVNA